MNSAAVALRQCRAVALLTIRSVVVGVEVSRLVIVRLFAVRRSGKDCYELWA